jgi:hypothetical protein
MVYFSVPSHISVTTGLQPVTLPTLIFFSQDARSLQHSWLGVKIGASARKDILNPKH